MSADIRWTEGMVLDRLRHRHQGRGAGNAPIWAYMEHVRNEGGFDANRTIDALAVHMWPSKGHAAHAYEVKVSRADFRRELADDMAKSATWRAWVDYFWIAAPVGVVPLAELPDGWGLLTCKDGDEAARVSRPAKRLNPDVKAVSRGRMVAMLRSLECSQALDARIEERRRIAWQLKLALRGDHDDLTVESILAKLEAS